MLITVHDVFVSNSVLLKWLLGNKDLINNKQTKTWKEEDAMKKRKEELDESVKEI